MGHIKTTEEKKKNFTIAVSANWSGMQLFPHPSSLFIKKTYSHLTASQWTISHHKQPARPPAPSHMAPGRAETQRSRETVGLLPPSVSVVGNLLAVPKNASQHSAFINTHPKTKAHACRQNAHVLAITPTFFSPSIPPCSRAILFDQKHFLCICCPPSDDFQTSPVIWWRADGTRGRICLEKPRFGLNKAAVRDLRPGSLPGNAGHMWDWVCLTAQKQSYLISGEGILASCRNLTLSCIIIPFVLHQFVVWDTVLKFNSACYNFSLRTAI